MTAPVTYAAQSDASHVTAAAISAGAACSAEWHLALDRVLLVVVSTSVMSVSTMTKPGATRSP